MAPSPSRVERACIARGLKMTGQRRVIAAVLSEAADYPDVAEVYRRARALDRHISVATVYRTVRLLEEAGLLQRHDFDAGPARYEAGGSTHQQHAIDVDTGQVIPLDADEHRALIEAIAADLGYDLVSCRLYLYGRKRVKP